MQLSPSIIQSAIRDANWQEFRLSLKGISTREKLNRLQGYLEEDSSQVRQIRVQNYLNAIARGGQIEPCNKSLAVIDQVRQATIRR
jgi:hypothetical protein